MVIKLISCEVFTREVCRCVAASPNVIDLEFTPKDAHNKPDSLRELLQERIDAASSSARGYDAIALCLGVCGTSTVGLKSRGIPVVMPRAHDCCTLYLGSKERFKEHFGDRPSTGFSAVGYIEHGNGMDLVREADDVRRQMGMDASYADLVEKYGEENAAYIWETLSKTNERLASDPIVFIDMPGVDGATHLKACQAAAESQGKPFERLTGDLSFIRALVSGEWNKEDFLVITEGEEIGGVYDLDEVVTAVTATPD